MISIWGAPGSRRLRSSGARGVLLALGFGASFAIVAGAGCARHAEKRAESAPVSVGVTRIQPERESGMVEAVGTLRSAHEATIAGKVMGTVVEIRKKAGDPVRKGEILLVIDSRDVAGQVAQAEGGLAQARAAATLAETNFRRFEQLRARGAASQLELDQARYQHETALGAVRQAEGAVATATSYQAYARIPAPFDGRVVDQLCEEGDLASPGRPLMKVEDTTHLRLFASLEASRAEAAVVGAQVEVRVPAVPGRTIRGTVSEVTPAADPATRSILVKIDLEEDPSLRAGLFGRAFLPMGERQVLRVPASAVVRRGGMTGVFVAEDGRAMFRMVSLNEDRAAAPEVTSGLAGGEAVVLEPPSALEVGSRVEVRP